jgi:hypothetical protein
MLTYCLHRDVADDGKITCKKIVRGDPEVTVAICAACPAAACNCGHLRFSLQREEGGQVILNWGSGRREIIESRPPGVRFIKAACAVLLRPIETAQPCAACPLRTDGFIRSIPMSEQVVVPTPPPVSLPPASGVAKIIRFPLAGMSQ